MYTFAFIGILLLSTNTRAQRENVNRLDQEKLLGVKVTKTGKDPFLEQNSLLVQALPDLSTKDSSSSSSTSSSSSSSFTSETSVSDTAKSNVVSGLPTESVAQNAPNAAEFVQLLREGNREKLQSAVAMIMSLSDNERMDVLMQIQNALNALDDRVKGGLLQQYSGILSVDMQSLSGRQELSTTQADFAVTDASIQQEQNVNQGGSVQSQSGSSVTSSDSTDFGLPQPFLGVTSNANKVPERFIQGQGQEQQTSTTTSTTRTQTVTANDGQEVSVTKDNVVRQTNDPELNNVNQETVVISTGDGTVVEQIDQTGNQAQQSGTTRQDSTAGGSGTKVHSFLNFNPNFDYSDLHRDQVDLMRREMSRQTPVNVQRESDPRVDTGVDPTPNSLLASFARTSTSVQEGTTTGSQSTSGSQVVGSVIPDQSHTDSTRVDTTVDSSATGKTNVVVKQSSGRMETVRNKQPRNEIERIRQMNREADIAAQKRARSMTPKFDFFKEFRESNKELINRFGEAQVMSWLQNMPNFGRTGSTMVRQVPARFSTFRTVPNTVDTSSSGNAIVDAGSSASTGTGVETEITISPETSQNAMNSVRTADNFPHGNANVQFVPMRRQQTVRRTVMPRRVRVLPRRRIRFVPSPPPRRRITRRRYPPLGPSMNTVRFVNQRRIQRPFIPGCAFRDGRTGLCISNPGLVPGFVPGSYQNRVFYPRF